MFLIMMNFVIAVIGDSYNSVQDNKREYMYKSKAEMNLDCQQLRQAFPNPDSNSLKCVGISVDKNLFISKK